MLTVKRVTKSVSVQNYDRELRNSRRVEGLLSGVSLKAEKAQGRLPALRPSVGNPKVRALGQKVLVPERSEQGEFFLTPKSHAKSYKALGGRQCMRRELLLVPKGKKGVVIDSLPKITCCVETLLRRFYFILLNDTECASRNFEELPLIRPGNISLTGSTVEDLLCSRELGSRDIDVKIDCSRGVDADSVFEQAVWVRFALGSALYELMLESDEIDVEGKEVLNDYWRGGKVKNTRVVALNRLNFAKLYLSRCEEYGCFVNPKEPSGLHFVFGDTLDLTVIFKEVEDRATNVSCLNAATLDLSYLLDANYRGEPHLPIKITPV